MPYGYGYVYIQYIYTYLWAYKHVETYTVYVVDPLVLLISTEDGKPTHCVYHMSALFLLVCSLYIYSPKIFLLILFH